MLEFFTLVYKKPEDIIRYSERRAIDTFRHAARTVPAYRELLRQRGVDPATIKGIADFKKQVPVISKKETFLEHDSIQKLCVKGRLSDLKEILASSGFSGAYSFGLSTKKDVLTSMAAIERVFEYIFDVREKRSLLVNALAMGVKVPLRPESPLAKIDTGPRVDTILAVIKNFTRCFEQIILIGANNLIKQVIEEAPGEGIDLTRLNIRIILGGDFFPESLRSYLLSLLDRHLEGEKKMVIGSSLGVSEIGLNIFFETRETVLIRNKASHSPALARGLFGQDAPFLPILFTYDPTRIYLEEEDGGLLVTALGKERIMPLVRYRTGDRGKVLAYGECKEKLARLGLGKYVPREPFPFVLFCGRGAHVDMKGKALYQETVREILYRNKRIAASLSGFFRLRKAAGVPVLELQLKKGKKALERAAGEYITRAVLKASGVRVRLRAYPYSLFPYGMEMDMTRKFEYVG
ncbi:MAG: hypothetical protein JW844_05270 [Candidatus Omnitrophica bacterium]|nr:hypothetical protein [Candidatus Omnitrophota bacterium]